MEVEGDRSTDLESCAWMKLSGDTAVIAILIASYGGGSLQRYAGKKTFGSYNSRGI